MKKVYKIINIIILLIFFSMFSSVVSAELLLPDGLTIKKNFFPGIGKTVGKVRFVQGQVYIVHDKMNQGFRALYNIYLYAKDTIFVLEMSRVNIAFEDGSILTLSSNTKITLSRIEYIPAKKHRVSYLNMDIGKGRFRVADYKNYKNSSFKVKTSNAIIGVCGSDFIIKATLTKTRVQTLKDTKLSLLSIAAIEEEPTLLDEFEWAVVEQGMLPSEVEPLAPVEVDSVSKEFDLGDNDYMIDDSKINENTDSFNKKSNESEDDSELIDTNQKESSDNEKENQDREADSNLITNQSDQGSDQKESEDDELKSDQVSDNESDTKTETDNEQDKETEEDLSKDEQDQDVDQQTDNNEQILDTNIDTVSDNKDEIVIDNVLDEQIELDSQLPSDPTDQTNEEQINTTILPENEIINENVDNAADIQQEIIEEQKEKISKMPWFPELPE